MEDNQPDFPAMKPNKYPWNDEVMKVLEMEPYTITYRSPEGREFKFTVEQNIYFLSLMLGKMVGWEVEHKGTFIPALGEDGRFNWHPDKVTGMRLKAIVGYEIERQRNLKRKEAT